MPGTYVHDTNVPVLLNSTLAVADTTTTGTGVAVNKPGDVRVEAALGTLSGASTNLDIEVQGSNDSTFATGVVSYGHFDSIGPTDDNQTRYLQARVYKTYMRTIAITSGGGSPSYVVAVRVRAREDHRTATDTA